MVKKYEYTIQEYLQTYWPETSKQYNLFEKIKTRQDAILYCKHDNCFIRTIANTIIAGKSRYNTTIII